MARRRRPPRPGALTELPPLKILSQIFILQALWYLSSTLLMLFTALVAGRPFTMSLVLSWQTLRGDTTWGFMLALIWLLNSSFALVSPTMRPTRNIADCRFNMQSYSFPFACFAQQNGPGLRHHAAFLPPRRYLAVFKFCAAELAMVAIAGSKHWPHDESGNLELSAKRITPHDFWGVERSSGDK